MKYRAVYRTEAGTVEIHSASCGEWDRTTDFGDEMLFSAEDTWGAAMEAWSHDTEPEICAVTYTLYFPCLTCGYTAAKRRARKRAVPFDIDASTDAEIIEACYGKLIRWTNGISGALEVARLYPEGPYNSKRRGIITYPHKFTKITYGIEGDATLNFIAVGGGFRAARLDAIVSVGGR